MKQQHYRTKSNRTLFDRISGSLMPRIWLNSRYDPVLLDGFSRRWWSANLAARRDFGGIDPRRLHQVGLFAFARGGSHLIASRLHMIPQCFCFGEGIADFSHVNWRTFLLRGIFRTESIQGKHGHDITHLVYNANQVGVEDRPTWAADRFDEMTRSWVFVTRNPFRILNSMARKRGMERVVEQNFRNFRDRTRHFRAMRTANPSRTFVVSFEQFSLEPTTGLHELCRRLDLPSGSLAAMPTAVEFFQTVFRCGSRPVVKDGHLVSPLTGERISGWGGGFNPLGEVDAKRAFRGRKQWPKSVLETARRFLGAEAVEFYLSDTPDQYRSVTADALLDLVD